jgi:hypothetical protein
LQVPELHAPPAQHRNPGVPQQKPFSHDLPPQSAVLVQRVMQVAWVLPAMRPRSQT